MCWHMKKAIVFDSSSYFLRTLRYYWFWYSEPQFANQWSKSVLRNFLQSNPKLKIFNFVKIFWLQHLHNYRLHVKQSNLSWPQHQINNLKTNHNNNLKTGICVPQDSQYFKTTPTNEKLCFFAVTDCLKTGHHYAYGQCCGADTQI